jgi:rhodanese-related sulfurtransferase
MKILNKDQLDQKLQDPDVVLINVLPREKFKKQHIPGSVNIPIDAPDFIRQIERKVEGRNQDVVVYCAGFKCDASTQAAEKLKAAGYKKIYDFKGGIEEWTDQGGAVNSINFRKKPVSKSSDIGTASASI